VISQKISYSFNALFIFIMVDHFSSESEKNFFEELMCFANGIVRERRESVAKNHIQNSR